MSVNSSSSSNASHAASSISALQQMHKCLNTTVGIFNFTAFTITSILILLPLCILVLKLGIQRRQEQHSSTINHADIFTYHMVIAELLNVLGSTLSCSGVHTDLSDLVTVGIYLSSISLSAQMLFHVLTCLERYLAVVHPITYLSLRKAKWIRIRNIIIGCVWLQCFAGIGSLSTQDQVSMVIISVCALVFTLIVISYFSLSVLCVLIRPGPGEVGGDRQRVDQSKLRAFYTIMAILGVLLFRFIGNMLGLALYTSIEESEMCAAWTSIFWFCLPSSLVSPLLFLQRAGKLFCCKDSKKSG